MKSKGGKIFYRCEACFSSDIFKKVTFIEGIKNIYICNSCQSWGEWKDRSKQSVLEYFNSIRPLTYVRKGSMIIIESKNVFHTIKRGRFHPGMLYEINFPTKKGEKYYYGKTFFTINGKSHAVYGALK